MDRLHLPPQGFGELPGNRPVILETHRKNLPDPPAVDNLAGAGGHVAAQGGISRKEGDIIVLFQLLQRLQELPVGTLALVGRLESVGQGTGMKHAERADIERKGDPQSAGRHGVQVEPGKGEILVRVNECHQLLPCLGNAVAPLDIRGKKIVSILSGGNMDVITMSSVVQQGLIFRNRIFTVSVLLPDKPGELQRVAGVIAEKNGNVIKLEHNQFVTTNRKSAVELRITIEAFGTEHKEQILSALETTGFKPKVVRTLI